MFGKSPMSQYIVRNLLIPIILLTFFFKQCLFPGLLHEALQPMSGQILRRAASPSGSTLSCCLLLTLMPSVWFVSFVGQPSFGRFAVLTSFPFLIINVMVLCWKFGDWDFYYFIYFYNCTLFSASPQL